MSENQLNDSGEDQLEINKEKISGIWSNTKAFLSDLLDIRKDSDRSETVESVRKDEDLFQKNVIDAFDYCANHAEALMTLGIQATSPNTGYGYIEYKESAEIVNKVVQFREKPNLETAQQFLEAGNFLWNAGIFIWSVALATINANPPKIATNTSRIVGSILPNNSD